MLIRKIATSSSGPRRTPRSRESGSSPVERVGEEVAHRADIFRLRRDMHLIGRLGRTLVDRRTVDGVDERQQRRVAGEDRDRQRARLNREAGAERAPTAAEHHSVAAVLRPEMCTPSFMMTPAPRKPMPETT